MGRGEVLPWPLTIRGAILVGATHSDTRARIESATAVLAGRKLWKCTRAADMACFDFGECRSVPDHRGGMREVGEYALHVQCAWRITRIDETVVGNQDVYYPAHYDDAHEDVPPEFDWDRDANRRDKLLGTLFGDSTQKLVVQDVEVGATGSLRIVLTDGYFLEVFPNDSLNHEHWRLFRPGVDEPHFIITGSGIEE